MRIRSTASGCGNLNKNRGLQSIPPSPRNALFPLTATVVLLICHAVKLRVNFSFVPATEWTGLKLLISTPCWLRRCIERRVYSILFSLTFIPLFFSFLFFFQFVWKNGKREEEHRIATKIVFFLFFFFFKSEELIILKGGREGREGKWYPTAGN